MQPSSLTFVLLFGLLGATGAFPWAGQDAVSPERGLRDPLEGLLGTYATNVSAADRRPDANHPFIDPGPTDQRGACPGLNVLANHGYIPRTGITTVAQAVNASNWVFNMGRDVATYLSTVQVSFAGNLDTQTFSIGGEDKRTYSETGIGSLAAGRQWGSDAHGRIEVDNSPTRSDFNLNKGDGHSGDVSRFRVLVEIAKKNGGQFNMSSINQLFAHNVDLSLATNPRFSVDGFQLNGVLGAYAFIGLLLPNGTMGSGGTANYESISRLLGFRANGKGDFCYVPERLPTNWYRTTQTFGFANSFLSIIPSIYNSNPYLTNTFGTYLANASRSAELVCAQFRTLLNSVPSALEGTPPERVDAAVDFIHVNLVQGLGVDKVFGCTSPRPKAGETTLYPLPPFDPKLQTKGQKQRYNICS